MATKVECGACKRSTPRGVKCLYCGALLVGEVECAGCKRRISGHITQCLYCGTRREASAAARDLAGAAAPDATAPVKRHIPTEWEFLLLGIARRINAGRLLEALELLDEAVVQHPDQVDAIVLRGDTLRRLGRYESALQTLRRALALAPQLAMSWYTLALCEVEVDLRPEALVSLLQCLRWMPESLSPEQRQSLGAALPGLFARIGAAHPSIDGLVAAALQGPSWPSEQARQLDLRITTAQSLVRPR